jgi:hypothetical protein
MDGCLTHNSCCWLWLWRVCLLRHNWGNTTAPICRVLHQNRLRAAPAAHIKANRRGRCDSCPVVFVGHVKTGRCGL